MESLRPLENINKAISVCKQLYMRSCFLQLKISSVACVARPNMFNREISPPPTLTPLPSHLPTSLYVKLVILLKRNSQNVIEYAIRSSGADMQACSTTVKYVQKVILQYVRMYIKYFNLAFLKSYQCTHLVNFPKPSHIHTYVCTYV